MNKLVVTVSAAAAVLLVAVVGVVALRGPAILGAGATAAPSPVLIARGGFVEHDWGPVELEATRQGSVVTGQLTVGRDRGAGWPMTVELQCARATEDGKVIIGGYVTDSQPIPELAGVNAVVYLKRGSPELGSVTIGSWGSQSWNRTYDPKAPAMGCIEYLDEWFTALGPDLPLGTVDGKGTIEFGPGAEPSP